MQDMWIKLSDVVLAWVSVAIADSHSQRAPERIVSRTLKRKTRLLAGFSMSSPVGVKHSPLNRHCRRLHAERFWMRFSSNWPSGIGDIVRKNTTFFCTVFLISAAEIGLSKMVKSISR